ncbi:MAG: acyl-CoA dehydrogenase family protein [Spirochaetia bacterium]|jgi:alkylation response protein AidB-like acyl-CoA dehydrogenase|nr:acyl-CoA dehydrogenase family protein [Spirochaetia bacterium]
MDFRLTPAQEMVQKTVRKFAEEVCEPIAAEIDREHRFPAETFRKLTECGITGLGFPKEYGGSGLDKMAQTIATEELAKKCAATAAIYSIHQGAAWFIHLFGTHEQKDRYLRPLLEGGVVGAFALTEPNAGSDASNVQTVAVEDGDDFVLNGSKCFISGGSVAGIYTILALTEPELKVKGISAFIVEAGTPGLKIGKIEEKMGIRGSDTAELIFENLRVPKENMLGKRGKGFSMALASIDAARITVAAAQGLGIAEGAFDLAVKYAKERTQFGKPIGYQQGIAWYLAEMKTRIEAARWLTYRGAWLVDQNLPVTTEGAIAKLYASETARFVTNLALQIHGGYGYMNDYALERMYRDAKITEIYEGTNEIQKLIISRSVLS